LCHFIIGHTGARHHLSDGMWLVVLRHTKIAGELVAPQAAVSSIMDSVLGRLPDDTFRMEVGGELAAEFQNM
jgi:hypothetical protein